GVSVSLSVALLLPGVGSVTPPGALTVAVFTNVPVALDAMLATSVYVIVAPTGRSTVSLMLPLPLAVKPEAPPLPTAVKVSLPTLAGRMALAVKPEAPPLPTAVKVSLPTLAGRMSLTVAPVTLLGPLLLTTIVYIVEVPGVTVATPSVLVIERSATRLTVSLSVALLLPGVG